MAGVVILLLVAGIGVAPNFNSLLIPIHASFHNNSKNSDIAMSASGYAFIRTLGMSLGISISGLICMSELQRLGDTTSTDIDMSRIIESLSGMDAAEKAKYTQDFASAMKNVFLQVTVVMAVGMLASFLIKSHKLGNAIRSDHKMRPTTADTASTANDKPDSTESLGGKSTETSVVPMTQQVRRTS